MKAKVKYGHNLLFTEGASNDWSNLTDKIIINFKDKNNYVFHRQWKNLLDVITLSGKVTIVFTGEVPLLEFESYEKDQLILKIK